MRRFGLVNHGYIKKAAKAYVVASFYHDFYSIGLTMMWVAGMIVAWTQPEHHWWEVLIAFFVPFYSYFLAFVYAMN